MALVLADRVQQTGTANTTVSFTLTGAVASFQSFAVIGNGNTTYYSAYDSNSNWEVGIGTYSTTGPTLTRTTILSSSNAGAAVTFASQVNVICTYPSSKSINQDASGFVGIGTTAPAYPLNLVSGITGGTIARFQGGANVFDIYSGSGSNSYFGDAGVRNAFFVNSVGNNAGFWVNNAEAFRAASGGAIGFGGANFGTAGQYLQSNGSSASPTWVNPVATVPNGLSFNQLGTGTTGTFTYNGSVAYTISYNTVGAASATGVGASGTWPIAISGNAATATNATNAANATTAGGFTPSQTVGAVNRIVVADGSGYINNNYFNSTDNSVTSGVTGVMVKQGDNFLRTGTAAAIAAFISGQTFNTAGNAATATTATNQSGGTVSATTIFANTSMTVAGNGSGNDPYGTCAVTEPANANNYSYYGLTRNGSIGAGFGLTGTNGALGLGANSFWFGSATSGTSGTMSGAWLAFNSSSMIASGNITAFSDERYKTDWKPVDPDFVAKLAKVKSGTYTRTDSGERQAGASAQSIKEILPEAVVGEGTLSLAYGNAALVAAVELAKVVQELRAEIAELKAKLA